MNAAAQRVSDVAAGRHDGDASKRRRPSRAEHRERRPGAHACRAPPSSTIPRRSRRMARRWYFIRSSPDDELRHPGRRRSTIRPAPRRSCRRPRTKAARGCRRTSAGSSTCRTSPGRNEVYVRPVPGAGAALAGLERRRIAAGVEPERQGDLLPHRRPHDGRGRHGGRRRASSCPRRSSCSSGPTLTAPASPSPTTTSRRTASGS